ncbi:MAG: division/cell wall cluster transcriptional repressor MraZ [Armatimonadetes bacterium]|nr:division/cell wall cluster transcriptional repressor MraZ [Armatimonadota bacterium]
MLKGEHHYALDEKGRVVLPPRFRRVLGDTVTVTRGLDKCLFVYSEDEWARVEEKLRGLPLTQRESVRFLLSGAVDCEMDRQGRITLPPYLRTYAEIDRDAVVVGMINRLEIWSQENWTAYLERMQSAPQQLASQLEGLIL